MSEDNPNNIISINGVSKFFGTVIALKDINFGVKKGEVHALLGDNGAGKSTLIKILSGVHNQDIGEYLVDDKPVKFGSPRDALDRGIAKEQARFLLPMSSKTKIYMTGNIRSWIHYLELRTGIETQKEHRDIAIEIKKIFKKELPIISGALEW